MDSIKGLIKIVLEYLKLKNNINYLPKEIIYKIFFELDIKNLYEIMVTCKLWKEIIEDILHKKTIYRIVSKQKNNFNYNTYIHIKW